MMSNSLALCEGRGAARQRIGFLGPDGSWTHQACLDLFWAHELVPLLGDELFSSYAEGSIDRACVPVTTSVVGVTPYLDQVLEIPTAIVVAEYPKMLGYSMLARLGSRIEDITKVIAHPVALEEVKPWLDEKMPTVERIAAASGGAAAKTVAEGNARDIASMGPKIGGEIYGLESLADKIEEGPHNVTRWWILGDEMPCPSGDDKTSLLVNISDNDFSSFLSAMTTANLKVLNIYERPSKKTLDTHRYLVDVAGHAMEGAVASFLGEHKDIRILGSYARRY
jgi:chorismate mutase/prephenate dehydratase